MTIYANQSDKFYNQARAKELLSDLLSKPSTTLYYLIGVAAFENPSDTVFDNPLVYFSKAAQSNYPEALFWAGPMATLFYFFFRTSLMQAPRIHASSRNSRDSRSG